MRKTAPTLPLSPDARRILAGPLLGSPSSLDRDRAKTPDVA
ncbi:Hypothetical protein I596_3242 [Dokdonella koreensis DS-123]|uniref:Uncharacterized protein n=1 Tax=Dokdonella koreensis DS-123 TaxID=1300342 RepID=A0A160DY08_9GAMM|nr:Hypothetical protein I596_3242 [Dokdonella koreensis DS-123]